MGWKVELARVVAWGIGSALLGACALISGVGDLTEVPALDSGTDGGVPIDGSGDGTTGAPDGRADSPVDATADRRPTDTGPPPADTGVDGGGPMDVTVIDTGAPPCPGGGGPTAISILGPNNRYYCVDSTEVTNAQYAAFLATNPSVGNQTALCTWNATFIPSSGWPADATLAANPVVYVDWCDAYGFCAWAGKHLCGQMEGGTIPAPPDASTPSDPTQDQWTFACSHGGMLAYPYDNTYVPSACNGSDNGAGVTLPVGSLATCEGGFRGLFDMNGNVDEWQDSCWSSTGPGDICANRGGSFGDPVTFDSCTVINLHDTRETPNPDVGFRCCSP